MLLFSSWFIMCLLHTTAAHQKVELDINFQLPCQLLKNQKDFQVFWLGKELQSNTAERGKKGGGEAQNPTTVPCFLSATIKLAIDVITCLSTTEGYRGIQ